MSNVVRCIIGGLVCFLATFLVIHQLVVAEILRAMGKRDD